MREGGRTLHDVPGDATARQCDVLHSQLPNHACAKGADGGAKDDDELAGSFESSIDAVQKQDYQRFSASSALVPHSLDLSRHPIEKPFAKSLPCWKEIVKEVVASSPGDSPNRKLTVRMIPSDSTFDMLKLPRRNR